MLKTFKLEDNLKYTKEKEMRKLIYDFLTIETYPVNNDALMECINTYIFKDGVIKDKYRKYKLTPEFIDWLKNKKYKNDERYNKYVYWKIDTEMEDNHKKFLNWFEIKLHKRLEKYYNYNKSMHFVGCICDYEKLGSIMVDHSKTYSWLEYFTTEDDDFYHIYKCLSTPLSVTKTVAGFINKNELNLYLPINKFTANLLCKVSIDDEDSVNSKTWIIND